MNTEMGSFLRQGIGLYSEARHTLAAFEREMEKLLGAALQSRARWSPLKKHRIGRPGAGGGRGDYGWWVSADITGRSPRGEEVLIDCGVWWDVLEADKPVLYASFYHKPKRVRIFKWPEGKQGISSSNLYGRTFLYVPVPKSVQIEKPLTRLLDALLKQLG